jgi:hypothetical protein
MLCSKLGAARVTLSDFVPPILDNLALSTRRNNIDARYTSLPSLCKSIRRKDSHVCAFSSSV